MAPARTATTSSSSPARRGLALIAATLASVALAFTSQPETQPADSTTGTGKQADYAYVLLNTSAGEVYLELDRKNAPVTVKNFLAYVEKDHYDGLVFHRVISNFMIQGGGFDADGYERGTSDPIRNESSNGLQNNRGTIAMARTNNPDSATAQFFINVKDNSFLNKGGRTPDDPSDDDRADAGYAVFGRVIKGMDVVDQIRYAATATRRTPYGSMPDWPVDDFVIEQARELTPEEVAALKASLKPAQTQDKPLAEPESDPMNAPADDAESAADDSEG